MIEQNEVVSSEGTGGGHVRASGKTDGREFKTSPSPPAGPFWTRSWREDQGQQGDEEAPRGCICLAQPRTDHTAALVETEDSRVGWDSLLQTGEKEASRGSELGCSPRTPSCMCFFSRCFPQSYSGLEACQTWRRQPGNTVHVPRSVLRKLANVQKELYAFLRFWIPNPFKISSQVFCVTLNLKFRNMYGTKSDCST